MKNHVLSFKQFLEEAKDPNYYQDTFYFTVLISMNKETGGSRDETKNDIRALPEILTVTLVEPEKGGVQRDLGTKYLSTLKIHARRPKGLDKELLMKRFVLLIGNFRGVSVLRYKERKPKPRKKAFRGPGSYKITESGKSYDWQSGRHKKDLKADTKALTSKSGKKKGKGGAPFDQSHNVEADWEKSPPGAPGGLEEDLLISIGPERNDLMAFDIHPTLNQKIWDGEKSVRSGVKGALMDIVEEFLSGLDLDLDLDDVVVTGSTANYNWSKFSDIDIHIIIDFEEINDNKDMVKKFFDAVRSNWNKLHNILVKGHEVEVYVQDVKEPHVSTGVYSLQNDRWLVKPKKVKPEIDRATSTKKMKSMAREVDKLSALYDNRQYQEAFELAQRIKEKIKRMRRSGLEKSGIYSPENLAFKMLRRSGDIEQLFSIYTQAYDKIYSLTQ